MNIGNRIEMFVDKALIHSMENCDLKLNPPVKKEKVMTFDRPWESSTSGYITIIAHDRGYMLYYRGKSKKVDDKLNELTCLAFSTDGINFKRPNFRVHEYDGSFSNNIILKGVPECHNFAPFVDTNPDSENRYMAVGGHERIDDTHGKLMGLKSNDGIRWNRISEEPVLTDGMFDSQNVVFYDSSIKKYRCYYRYFDKNGKTGLKPYEGIRSIKSSVSEDMFNWEPGRNNQYDVSYKEEFYTNATVQCPGAEHIYMSFPKRFMAERKRDFYTDAPAVSDAVFMTSRDGLNWNRTFKEAWVRPGLDRHNWVNRNNMTALGIIETSPTEFSMYISEHYRSNTNGLRRLSIRKYGFASINAGYDSGTMTTIPIEFTGSFLMLNFSTSAAGLVKVDLLDENFKLLTESNEMYGDEIFERVDFRESLKQFEGHKVRLRFTLKDADVYAFRFTEDTE